MKFYCYQHIRKKWSMPKTKHKIISSCERFLRHTLKLNVLRETACNPLKPHKKQQHSKRVKDAYYCVEILWLYQMFFLFHPKLNYFLLPSSCFARHSAVVGMAWDRVQLSGKKDLNDGSWECWSTIVYFLRTDNTPTLIVSLTRPRCWCSWTGWR